jgi:hypothetical protein
MPQSGSQNQTLLDLIYALKSLAQQVEFYHQDLSRRLEEESRSRRSDISRVVEIGSKTQQMVSVLPITLSDRVEKLLERLEHAIDGNFNVIQSAIVETRQALQEYTRATDRALSHNEATEAAKPTGDRQDITGRIEVTDKGEVRVLLNSRVLKKIWYVVVVIATGGGAYGFVELVKNVFGIGGP